MPRVTLFEYALICADTYQNNNLKYYTPLTKRGWRREDFPNSYQFQFTLPFFARLYVKRTPDKTIMAAVIAYRGTVPLQLRNDLDDFQLGILHEMPSSYKHACQFYLFASHYTQATLGTHCRLTGHSLGGALAQLVAIKSTQHPPTVVFNSPGIGLLDGVNNKLPYSYIHNFNTKEGIINKVGQTLGQLTSVDFKPADRELQLTSTDITSTHPATAVADLGLGIYQEHSIGSIIKDLKQHAYLANEVF